MWIIIIIIIMNLSFRVYSIFSDFHCTVKFCFQAQCRQLFDGERIPPSCSWKSDDWAMWIETSRCPDQNRELLVSQVSSSYIINVMFVSIIIAFVLHVRLLVDWLYFCVFYVNCMLIVLPSVCLCLSLRVIYCLSFFLSATWRINVFIIL